MSYIFSVCCHVPVQDPALGKWFPANVALVRFLFCVLHPMPGELPSLGELLATLIAPKLLLSSVVLVWFFRS